MIRGLSDFSPIDNSTSQHINWEHVSWNMWIDEVSVKHMVEIFRSFKWHKL
jgi:hypothetical protein